MPVVSRLGGLKKFDPLQWAEEVRAALMATGGDVGAAAERMDIARRTLSRWIACEERGQGSCAADSRCGKCEGCRLVKGIDLRAPGGPGRAKKPRPAKKPPRRR